MINIILSYTIELPKQERFCFSEFLEATGSLQATFFVVSGGSLEISSKISDPNGIELQHVTDQSSFSYAVDAQ